MNTISKLAPRRVNAIAEGNFGRVLVATAAPWSSRCRPTSPPPTPTAYWLRPRSRRRCSHVSGIIIGGIRGELLASDVGGEQTLNIGKAGEIAQRIPPSPGSAVSFVTSAHDDTRLGLALVARDSDLYYFKLE
jgi:hypothetical protein